RRRARPRLLPGGVLSDRRVLHWQACRRSGQQRRWLPPAWPSRESGQYGWRRPTNADFRKPLTLLITQSLQVRRAETLFILHFQWITALEERSWNLPGISPLKP